MELWLPLTDRITGDLRSEEPWNALTEILETTWLDKEGNAYKPVMRAIDVQGATYPETLEFVRANGGRLRLRAVRGYAPARALAAGRSFGILRNTYQDKATHVTVTNVDVDIGKNIIAEMLSRKEAGAGLCALAMRSERRRQRRLGPRDDCGTDRRIPPADQCPRLHGYALV